MNALARRAAAALLFVAPVTAAAQPRAGVPAAIDAARRQPAVAQVFGGRAELAARLDLAERRSAAERREGLQDVLNQLEIASGAVYRVLRGVGPRPAVATQVVRAAR
ncbi:MAG: hypothetical protein H6704_29645 [Myxococcales bacterium]|nr:hypothetical protein [Myxococcales bacterium]